MTSRSSLITLALACAYTCGAFAESLPRNCAILPLSQGPDAVAQCSRLSPDRVTGFWTPSIAQVRAVEQRLAALLKNSGHKIELSRSRRQYVGVVSRGKRLIYVNAFSITEPDSAFEADWRSTAFTVCDGGDEFWGVAFDPARGAFDFLGFNGKG